MSAVVEQLAAAIRQLAHDMPDHKPAYSAFWETTSWHIDGAPNSILAYAVEEVDRIASKIPAGAFTSLEGNVGMPSENLPRWGVALSSSWAAWFDRVALAEHQGKTWGEAVAAAGPTPVEAVEVSTPTSEVPESDGVFADVDEDTYHGDPGSLSSSQARTILRPGGPALLRYGVRRVSDAFDFGHVAHELILGKGSGIEVVDADDWRSKAAKDARADARKAGRVPVLRKDFERAERLRDNVFGHPLAAVLFESGVAERSMYAHDPATGVRLRSRPDWQAGAVFVDLKTTADAARFEKSVADFGYHQQAAWYVDVAALLGIEVDGFVFVAVEKEPPYLVTVAEIDDSAIEVGRRLNRAAIELYARCAERDEWPGLPAEIRTIHLPEWAFAAADRAIEQATNTIERISQ